MLQYAECQAAACSTQFITEARDLLHTEFNIGVFQDVTFSNCICVFRFLANELDH